MRVVVRIYKDAYTKPHHDEYKTDADSEREVFTATGDIGSFLEEAFAELEDEYVGTN